MCRISFSLCSVTRKNWILLHSCGVPWSRLAGGPHSTLPVWDGPPRLLFTESESTFYRVTTAPSGSMDLFGLHGLSRNWNFVKCFWRWCSPIAVRLARTFQKLQFCEVFLKVVLTKWRKGCTGCPEIAILWCVFEINVNVTGLFTATYRPRQAVPGRLDYLKSGLGC